MRALAVPVTALAKSLTEGHVVVNVTVPEIVKAILGCEVKSEGVADKVRRVLLRNEQITV